jgi:hypothetical protein
MHLSDTLSLLLPKQEGHDDEHRSAFDRTASFDAIQGLHRAHIIPTTECGWKGGDSSSSARKQSSFAYSAR